MVEKRSVRYWLFALALILTVFYLFPLVLVGINSVKTTGQFTTNPFTLPTRLVAENYPQAFSQMHFPTALRNTLILTVSICVLVAVFGSMAAYGISWDGDLEIWPPIWSAGSNPASFPFSTI